MADKKKLLTAKAVENLKEPGKYLDAGGLYLQISSSGSKSWIFRYDINKKRREMGLGSFAVLGLADARLLRNEQRKFLKKGIDPLDAQKQTKTRERLERLQREKYAKQDKATFKIITKDFLAAKEHEWKNAKHRQQWRNTLETYADPFIGEIPVRDITRHDVLKVLEPHWLTKNETMTRVRQRIESVLNYAIAKEYREGTNPAEWKTNLKPLLPDPSKVQKPLKKHHSALPYDQITAFMSELRDMDGSAAKALRLTILTATRTSEVLQATWAEIDLKKKIWTIPAERMKAGIEHRVALSDTANDLIQSLPKNSDWLFPGAREGRPLSNVSMLMVLRRMKRDDITVHGFRSTFRDWIAEQTHYPARVAETALAHQLKDSTEKAYQRGDLIKKRFEMMEAWSSYCESHKAKVVRLPA